jgi:mono/diheme cytochrome c family protein
MGRMETLMNRFSAIWPSAAYVALCLTLVAWAAAHGPKNWPVPEEARKLKNPVPASAASLAAAKAVYVDTCAQCHGEEGKGDGPEAPMYDVKPADFSDAHMMGEMTDGEIFWKIGEGRRPIPSFKKRLTDEQRWQLVNYVRTFALKPVPAPQSTSAPANKAAPPKP